MRKRKLRSSGMAKTILQGTVKGAKRRGRRAGKMTSRNGQEWSFGDLLRAAEDRERRKGMGATSSMVPRRPSKLRD